VFGLTKTDQEWSEKLDAALTAARRDDLEHGTNAAYLHGWVCKDCRTYQHVRMGRNQGLRNTRFYSGQLMTLMLSTWRCGALVSPPIWVS
jgi:hypothetical protein